MGIKGFEKFSLLDYDNQISCVIFYAGCNMRCPFCHNASLVLNPNSAPDIPFEEVYEYLKLRKNVIDAVVFTGGEPTLIPDIQKTIMKVKNLGYKVKLDTNGTNPIVVQELIKNNLVDYIAMDIKNSFTKYDFTSGVNINKDKIKESIDLIMNSGVDYEFRTTIINGHHTLEDIKEIAQMIKGAKKYRLQKFTDRGTCISEGLSEVSKEEASSWVEELKKTISDVSLRGY